jgi:hypothetical protein
VKNNGVKKRKMINLKVSTKYQFNLSTNGWKNQLKEGGSAATYFATDPFLTDPSPNQPIFA